MATSMLATPEMPGAVESIAWLVVRFEGRVWLVSKCGPRVRDPVPWYGVHMPTWADVERSV